jgi:hypothetical protein
VAEAANAIGSLVVSSGVLRGVVVDQKVGAAARTLFDAGATDLPTRQRGCPGD